VTNLTGGSGKQLGALLVAGWRNLASFLIGRQRSGKVVDSEVSTEKTRKVSDISVRASEIQWPAEL